jgi:hypothetical protein
MGDDQCKLDKQESLKAERFVGSIQRFIIVQWFL